MCVTAWLAEDAFVIFRSIVPTGSGSILEMALVPLAFKVIMVVSILLVLGISERMDMQRQRPVVKNGGDAMHSHIYI